MIKNVLIFFVLVSAVEILTNLELVCAWQAPQRDYSDESEKQEYPRDNYDHEPAAKEEEEEVERGYSDKSTQQQPPREYPDDNGDGDSNNYKNTKP